MEFNCVFCKDKLHGACPASLAFGNRKTSAVASKKLNASGKIAVFPNSPLEPTRANRLP
jgi:hypothetical protein